MLPANRVVDAVQPPPHHPEEAFNAVRMHVAARVFEGAVAHCVMAARELLADPNAIARPFVRIDAGRRVDVLSDHAFEARCRHVCHDPWPHATAALHQPDDDGLLVWTRLPAI